MQIESHSDCNAATVSAFIRRVQLESFSKILAAGAAVDDADFLRVQRFPFLRTLLALCRTDIALAVSRHAAGAHRGHPPRHPQMRAPGGIRHPRAAGLARVASVKKQPAGMVVA